MNRADFLPHVSKQSWFFGRRKTTLHTLDTLSKQHAGRSVFESRFTLEDQVLTHLIFSNRLPVRVFTRAKNEYFEVLARTVDYYEANIEIVSHQSALASVQFATAFPDRAAEFEQNPGIAPIAYILRSGHLAISGSRAQQLAAQHPGAYLAEAENDRQKTFFHPLLHWSDAQLYEYVFQHKIPFDLLPGADVARIRSWAAAQRPIARIFDWLPQNIQKIRTLIPQNPTTRFSKAAL